jgi:predicted transcriptional regulator
MRALEKDIARESSGVATSGMKKEGSVGTKRDTKTPGKGEPIKGLYFLSWQA